MCVEYDMPIALDALRAADSARKSDLKEWAKHIRVFVASGSTIKVVSWRRDSTYRGFALDVAREFKLELGQVHLTTPHPWGISQSEYNLKADDFDLKDGSILTLRILYVMYCVNVALC